MIAGGIIQINIVVGTIIASLQPGAVSWLYYADRLYQLPLGIVGIAIGIVLLPDLARALRAGRDDDRPPQPEPLDRVRRGADAAGGGGASRHSRADHHVLFEHGAFTAADTAATAPALAAYAAGLPAFVAIKVFQPGYFAREDTRDADVVWRRVDGGQRRRRLRPLLSLRPCRHRRRDLARRLGQRRRSSSSRWRGAAIRASTRRSSAALPLLALAVAADGRRAVRSPRWRSRRGSAIRDLVVEVMALAALVAIGLVALRRSSASSPAPSISAGVAGLGRRRRT